jgi:hypothetical protein
MHYFDYESCAREAGISDSDLSAIKELLRDEFPTDEMMWELHVLRACLAIMDGHITVQDATTRRAA